MNNKLFVFLIMLVTSVTSNAQSNNDLYKFIPQYDPPKSPNAASFEKYTAMPVTYQTGQVGLSIPLVNFTVDGLIVPITIRYSNTGLRISDVASSVGLGWNLDAGGMITRDVKSIPDDGPNGLMTTYNATCLTRLLNNQMTGLERWNYFTQITKKLADVEHDVFHYNFLGNSGSFYISQGQCIQFPQTNNKITYTTQANGQLASFTIVSETGDQFLFSTKEESTIASISSPQTGNQDSYFPSLKGSTWHLSQIQRKII